MANFKNRKPLTIRTERINTYHATAKRVTANQDKENLATLKILVDHGKPESEEVELELMKQHIGNYGKIYEHLEKLTTSVSDLVEVRYREHIKR